MVLKNGEKEVTLQFQTKAYMALRSELKCENLRETLVEGCSKENLEMLAKGIKVFSDGKISSVFEAYEFIDSYCKDNGNMRRTDMFIQFIVQLGEHGFFGEAKTESEIRQMVNDPYLGLVDEKEMNKQMIQTLKEKVIGMMADKELASMMIGANTSNLSDQPLTKAE